MTAPDLKPYPAYKDSVVAWLGDVPNHWQLRRTKTLLRERSEKGHPDEPLLAATQTKGVVLKEQYENRTVLALKDLHLLKLVRVGDFVISLRSFQGGIEYARDQGIISPAYTVLHAIDPATHGYLAWLFKSRSYIDNLRLHVTGIRQGQNLDYEKLGRSVLPLPPSDDRLSIVRFLNHADRSIRRYISAKQKLIKVLEEQKQAIINRTVTCGLDPSAHLKPTGSQFIAQIPEHWSILQIRRLVSTVTSGSRGWATFYSDEGDIFLQSGNLGRSMSLNLSTIQHVHLPSNAEGVRTRVQRDDLLICITGALTGNVILVDRDLAKAYVNQHVALVRPRRDAVLPKFLGYCLYSKIGRVQFKATEYGGTKQGLGLDEVKSAVVPLPPRAEQDQIVKALDEQLTTLNLAVEQTLHEIGLVREYRTRLIADVVTGKLDVRRAAEQLLDETEEPEELPLADDVLEEGEGAELASEELAEEEVAS